MRIDGGSGRPKKRPAKKNKKAEALLKGIADEAVKKLSPVTPQKKYVKAASRIATLDRAQRKTKERVIEPPNRGRKPVAGPPRPSADRIKRLNSDNLFERAGEKKGGKQRRFVDPLIVLRDGKPHFAKGTGGLLKTQTRRDLETLTDSKQSPVARAKALTALQKSGNKQYRLPSDSVLKKIADGKLDPPKPEKKKGRSLLDKLSYAIPVVGPSRVVAKGLAPVGGVVLKGLAPVGGVVLKGLEAMQDLNEIGDARSKAHQSSGIAPKFDIGEVAKRGIYASGGAAFSALDRPLAATEAAVGTGLVEVGAIKGDTAAKIRKARGPIKAFTQGRDWKKDVSGADIVGGLGGPRELGIGLDLAIDPLMWAGLALSPATGGASGATAIARAAARVKALDAARLESAPARAALEAFKKDRDGASYAKALDALIPESEVKELRRASVKDTVTRAQKHKGDHEIELNGKKHYVSGAGADAVAEAVKNVTGKGKKAQLRLVRMSPLGKVKGRGVPVTPDFSGLPTPARGKAYEKRLAAVNESARSRITTKAKDDIAELDAKITAVRHKAPPGERNTRIAALTEQIADIKLRRLPTELAAVDETPPSWTLGDRINDKSAKTLAHASVISGGNFGRMTEQKFSKLRDEAFKPLEGAPDVKKWKRERLQLAREIEQTTGTSPDFLKLAPDEAKALEQVRKVDDLQGQQSLQANTLDRLHPNYTGYRIYERGMSRSALNELVDSRLRPANTSHQKHRSTESMFDIVDPNDLAEQIVRLSPGQIDLTAARQIAEDLHDTGLQRSMSELHVRRLQRGEPLLYDDLTELERSAVARSARAGIAGKEDPLFRAPIDGRVDTDGYLLAGNWDAYDIPLTPYDGIPHPEARTAAIIRDVEADREFVTRLREQAQGARADDLDQIIARYDDELERLRAAPEAPAQAAVPEAPAAVVPDEIADYYEAFDAASKAADDLDELAAAFTSVSKRQGRRDAVTAKKQTVITDRLAEIDEELARVPEPSAAVREVPEEPGLHLSGVPEDPPAEMIAGARAVWEAAKGRYSASDLASHFDNDKNIGDYFRENPVEYVGKYQGYDGLDQWRVPGTPHEPDAREYLVMTNPSRSSAMSGRVRELDPETGKEIGPTRFTDDERYRAMVDQHQSPARKELLAEKAALEAKLVAFQAKLEASGVKAQGEIDSLMAARIEAQAKTVPAPDDDIVMEIGADGGAWLKGAENADEVPDVLPPPRGDEPGPFDHPDDILKQYNIPDEIAARLPDARQPGLVPELDPVITGVARDRAQGIAVGFASRWQGIDQIVGRSMNESQSTWTAADGSTGLASELRAVRDERGEVTHYLHRHEVDDEGHALAYATDEVGWAEGTLIPNSEGSVWYDPISGAEYVAARKAFDTDPQGIRLPETTLWPSRVVDHLKAQANKMGETDTVYDDTVAAGINKLTSSVRFGVTLPFPAYHLRNLYSDMLKSLQADAGVMFHPIANAKLALGAFNRGLDHKINVPNYGDMEMSDFLFIADMFGVRTGHQATEIQALLQSADVDPSRFQSLFSKGVRQLSVFSGHREDIVRLQTFTQRLRANGGDAADASWYMVRHHFDYNDLAANERRYVRNVFLFYTWYRKNIPLQLVELARRPGFMAGVSHVYQGLEAGETPLNIGPFDGPAPANPARPDYVRDKLQAATLPWNGHALDIGFGAPWADMGLLTWGEDGIFGNAGIAMLNPLVSTAPLMALRRDPVTGRRWRGQEPSGAADTIQALSNVMDLGDLPTDEKGRPTLPWALHYAIRATPFLGRALHTASGSGPARDPGLLQEIGRLTAPLTGLNISVSPEPGPRQDLAIEQLILAEVVSKQRQAFIDYGNLKNSDPIKKKALAKLKKEAIEFVDRKGIDKKYLRTVKQSGFYTPKSRKSSGGLGGGGLGGGLGGGGLK